ncbi:reverse transcriptase-like protein [Elysia marginata]|uniref:Reverse transcriptase-like protein n=1 Tax=Elysia marginata TaxID=1093978 RepID=A0AAV4JJN3_9GAST|nr:reverse transcriptase-like protein [Elysia marginata]
MRRLSLIKRLASTSWGSDMDTLRSLYLGYVRSVLDYLCLQASSSKTVQSEIDKVQNHALRFICGGMRSTRTAACEIHARVEPLGLRREKASLEM